MVSVSQLATVGLVNVTSRPKQPDGAVANSFALALPQPAVAGNGGAAIVGPALTGPAATPLPIGIAGAEAPVALPPVGEATTLAAQPEVPGVVTADAWRAMRSILVLAPQPVETTGVPLPTPPNPSVVGRCMVEVAPLPLAGKFMPPRPKLAGDGGEPAASDDDESLETDTVDPWAEPHDPIATLPALPCPSLVVPQPTPPVALSIPAPGAGADAGDGSAHRPKAAPDVAIDPVVAGGNSATRPAATPAAPAVLGSIDNTARDVVTAAVAGGPVPTGQAAAYSAASTIPLPIASYGGATNASGDSASATFAGAGQAALPATTATGELGTRPFVARNDGVPPMPSTAAPVTSEKTGQPAAFASATAAPSAAAASASSLSAGDSATSAQAGVAASLPGVPGGASAAYSSSLAPIAFAPLGSAPTAATQMQNEPLAAPAPSSASVTIAPVVVQAVASTAGDGGGGPAAPAGTRQGSGAPRAAAPLVAARRPSPAAAVPEMLAGLTAEVRPTVSHPAAPALAPDRPLDMRDTAWLDHMVERMTELRDAGGARIVHLKLLPEALGAIDVRIRHDGGASSVELSAQNPATQQMLADAAPRLAGMAAERGITLGDTSVSGGASQGGTAAQSGRGDRQSQPERPATTQRSTGEDTPRSTGKLTNQRDRIA